MKTLDEVIAELEDEEVFADALYYLRMYRSDMQMYTDNQKYWEDELKQKIKDFGDAKDRYINRLKELNIGTLNDSLTWDELKQMEGKPVWVELNSEYGNYSHWGIIHSFPKAGYEFMELLGFHDIVSFSVMQKEQGKTWQAYRKERDEQRI